MIIIENEEEHPRMKTPTHLESQRTERTTVESKMWFCKVILERV